MGKLIVFEGIDGSGKSTQYRMLCERLKREGISFRNLVFPRYENPSSALIRMYLNGEFGENPADVNAYAASSFFAVDRYASYMQDWKSAYEAGELIITDRYTTSNAVHQASKLPEAERGAFLDWLYEFEYEKLGLPKPDMVLFLDVSLKTSLKHLREREADTGTKADIHERDSAYLLHSIEAAHEAAKRFAWNAIDGSRGAAEIAAEIYEVIRSICKA